MIGLIQRVKQADICVEDKKIAAVSQGMLLFLGVEKDDSEKQIQKMATKIINYRIFENNDGKMDFNIQDVQGEILVVSQFTLAAQTNKGNRPSFSSAMPPPAQAKQIYDRFYSQLNRQYPQTQQGVFGADMQITLINDGPVTFILKA